MQHSDIVYKTCLLLVHHFHNLIYHSDRKTGFHTRIFSHVLHPEKAFVYVGQSEKVTAETPTHLEHVVPCAILISECKRLIKAGNHTLQDIAVLLQTHWNVAIITKKEQTFLDVDLGYKSTMPDGWTFETGNTLARFELAKIRLCA
ncbi:hypothetical protein [Agitococcus lubricus]|nr:hypothetical protein [Agitococcus lubricus]